jgi:G:T-mismatch repair DNA endonuclease (very short patch repair protein)
LSRRNGFDLARIQRNHQKGKPDFVFPKHSNLPRNNQEFWAKKLQANKDRDKFVNRELRKLGWIVVRVWEHELKYPEKAVVKVKRRVGE